MIRLAWVTDLHLDFVDRTAFTNLIDDLQNALSDFRAGLPLDDDLTLASFQRS